MNSFHNGIEMEINFYVDFLFFVGLIGNEIQGLDNILFRYLKIYYF